MVPAATFATHRVIRYAAAIIIIFAAITCLSRFSPLIKQSLTAVMFVRAGERHSSSQLLYLQGGDRGVKLSPGSPARS